MNGTLSLLLVQPNKPQNPESLLPTVYIQPSGNVFASIFNLYPVDHVPHFTAIALTQLSSAPLVCSQDFAPLARPCTPMHSHHPSPLDQQPDELRLHGSHISVLLRIPQRLPVFLRLKPSPLLISRPNVLFPASESPCSSIPYFLPMVAWARWPEGSFWSSPGPHLPQNRCTCYSYCLNLLQISRWFPVSSQRSASQRGLP